MRKYFLLYVETIHLGIQLHLKFEKDDFSRLEKETKQSFTPQALDSLYQIAVWGDHLSAAVAIEKFRNFPAFRIGGKRLFVGHPHHYTSVGRVPCYLYEYTNRADHLGFYVTSMESTHLNLCRYQDEEAVWHQTPQKRLRLTVEDVIELDKQVREAQKTLWVEGRNVRGMKVQSYPTSNPSSPVWLVQLPEGEKVVVRRSSRTSTPHWTVVDRREAEWLGVRRKDLDLLFP